MNYHNGTASFNLLDLIEGMTREEKMDLIESMSCDDEIVTFVGQQIIDKWTENGLYSGVSCTATATAYHGLDKVWRDVAKASGDVAKREIERLERAIVSANELGQKGWDAYHELQRNRYERMP